MLTDPKSYKSTVGRDGAFLLTIMAPEKSVMTITKSLTRNTRHMRKAITPTAMAKLQALETPKAPYKHRSPSSTWSETQPNTIIAKSWRGGEREKEESPYKKQ